MTTALMEPAAEYAEKHNIFQLFEGLMQELIIKKPEDPFNHLIKVLKRDAVPRVVVSGPPGADSRSLCELIAAKSKPNLVHVIASDVWRELSRIGSDVGKKAKEHVDNGEEVPSDLLLEMLVEKLNTGDCVSQGWILEGFPTTVEESRKMVKKGLLPTRFLQIRVDDAECVRRQAGRRIDTVSNTIYHLEDYPPPNSEVAGRLEQRSSDTKEAVTGRVLKYRQAMAGVLPIFTKVLKELDGSTPGEKGVTKLLEAALPLITADMPSRAPRGCPRVLLIGGPGSNTETLGAGLAQVYGVKHISAIELLHGAALNGSKAAERAMANAQPLVMAEELVGPLVLGRLGQEDVRTAGFVLTGYPRTTKDAAYLKKQGQWLRHVVHLELEPKAAEAIVTGTRYDPSDGEIFHIETKPPSDEDTAARLVTHPKDEPKAFKAAMRVWAESMQGLSKVYANELLTENANRPERELVERLAPCFLLLGA